VIIAKNIKFLLIFTEYSSYRKSGAPHRMRRLIMMVGITNPSNLQLD